MDTQVQELGVQLANVAVQNTAGAIGNKIKALKAGKDDRRTIAELEEIINGLVSERSEIIRLAQAYEQELVAQRISDEDIDYLTKHLYPMVEHLAESAEDGGVAAKQSLEKLKPLLSAQTVTILQLIGFNFKRAIGEPLTDMLAKLISSKAPIVGVSKEAFDLQIAEQTTTYLKLMLDPEAFARWRSVQ